MQQSIQNNQQSKLHPAAYFFVISGGGIVGTDYATWLEVSPVVGALIGGAISFFILKLAHHLYTDPENEIKDGLTKLGGVVGAVIGFYIGIANATDGADWVITTAVLGVVGALTGQLAATIIAFAGFAVLFLSQGPIGFALRTAILNSN